MRAVPSVGDHFLCGVLEGGVILRVEKAVRTVDVIRHCPVCGDVLDSWSIRVPACRRPRKISEGKPFVLATYWTCRDGHRGKTETPYDG